MGQLIIKPLIFTDSDVEEILRNVLSPNASISNTPGEFVEPRRRRRLSGSDDGGFGGVLRSASSVGDSLGRINPQQEAQSPVALTGADSPVLFRHLDQAVVFRLANINFRQSFFLRPTILNTTAPPHPCSFTSDSPFTVATTTAFVPQHRYLLRVGDARIVDGLAASMIRHLMHVQRRYSNARTISGSREGGLRVSACEGPMLRASVTIWPSAPSTTTTKTAAATISSGYAPPDLEAEAKVSVQPVQINLDQVWS